MLSIAPDKKMQAVMLVQQDDRNDFKEGQKVLLRCYHLPDRIYKGTIAIISNQQSDYAPRSLSNKVGGDLSTTSDSEGREKLTNISYQATVVLDQDLELLQPECEAVPELSFQNDLLEAGFGVPFARHSIFASEAISLNIKSDFQEG